MCSLLSTFSGTDNDKIKMLIVIVCILSVLLIASVVYCYILRNRKNNSDNSGIDKMLDVLTNNSENAYVLFSPNNLNVKYVTSNIEKLTGFTVEEVMEDMSVIFPEGTTREMFVNGYMSVRLMANIPRRAIRIHKVTGEQRYFFDSFYETEFDNETYLVLVLGDRTRERNNSVALETAVQTANQANKAKTDFLSNMSHDIRTPMNTIFGLITLIKREINNPDRAMKYLEQMETSSAHMIELINNILDMSRIESGKTVLETAPVNINELFNEISDMYSVHAKAKSITVNRNIVLKNDMYLGDATRIKKILTNIISNAIKYTNSGGWVNIDVKSEPIRDTGYDTLVFTIRDNGIGMSSEFIKDLFEPFARENNTTMSGVGGTGLGMAIEKNLVNLMNGHIHVQSEVGEGTEFIIEIPLKCIVENITLPKDSGNIDDINLEGMKILVVEDHDLNAMILFELLEEEGIHCVRAKNGKEGLEMFEKSETNEFDLILMDVQMPVMNGYDATKAIRVCKHPRATSIPIAAMTANAFAEDVDNALNAGMNMHIAKPVDMVLLKRKLGKIVRSR